MDGASSHTFTVPYTYTCIYVLLLYASTLFIHPVKFKYQKKKKNSRLPKTQYILDTFLCVSKYILLDTLSFTKLCIH